MPILNLDRPTPIKVQAELVPLVTSSFKVEIAPTELAREIALEAGRTVPEPSDLRMAEAHLDSLQASGGAAASMTNDLLTERAWLRRMLGDQNWQRFEELRAEVIGTQIAEFNAAEQNHLVREHSLVETVDFNKFHPALLFSDLASGRVKRAETFANVVCQVLATDHKFNALADQSVRKELLSFVQRSIVEPFALFSNQ